MFLISNVNNAVLIVVINVGLIYYVKKIINLYKYNNILIQKNFFLKNYLINMI